VKSAGPCALCEGLVQVVTISVCLGNQLCIRIRDNTSIKPDVNLQMNNGEVSRVDMFCCCFAISFQVAVWWCVGAMKEEPRLCWRSEWVSFV
jgi:hypothetical protein